MKNLGLDMWMEILSGVGVKDLIRLKSVSKSFLDLISKDDFIRLHLNKSSSRVIHLDGYGYGYIFHCLKQHGEAESSLRFMNWRTYVYYLEQNRGDGIFETISYGSCNGLVCLMSRHNNKYTDGVLLWNPALHEVEYVPIKRPPIQTILCSWFGYDNDEYKLILGTHSHIHLIRLYRDTDSWKSSLKIDEYFRPCVVQQGTLVHRTLHWPAYNRDRKITIISYDLSSETVGWIATPDGVNDLWVPVLLGQVDGCLCLSIYYSNKEAWIMKEYGVHESWTKLMTHDPIYDRIDFYVESLISQDQSNQDVLNSVFYFL